MKQPNSRKRDKLASELAIYLRQIGRKAQNGQDPNDRGYDREFERKLKRMSPLEIDALSREEDEGDQQS